MTDRSNTLSSAASWVIRNKFTGEVVCETFNPKHVKFLNLAKYEAMPTLKYLQSLNSNKTSTA
jgi:hypothetical protein